MKQMIVLSTRLLIHQAVQVLYKFILKKLIICVLNETSKIKYEVLI